MTCAAKDRRLAGRQSTTACFSTGYVNHADASEQRVDHVFTATGQA